MCSCTINRHHPTLGDRPRWLTRDPCKHQARTILDGAGSSGKHRSKQLLGCEPLAIKGSVKLIYKNKETAN
jgi:hypothetical protein